MVRLAVLKPINFDDEAMLQTSEIDNVGAKWYLTAKA